jgi:putative ABC transport system substrate-binding protein
VEKNLSPLDEAFSAVKILSTITACVISLLSTRGAMEKNTLLSIVVVVMHLAVGVIAHAQQPKKVPRIGYLASADPNSNSASVAAIAIALRELGYVEGQNIVIEYRSSGARVDRLPELAAELVRLKVGIILVLGGAPPIRAAKNATKTIPIIMAGQGIDPVKAGFAESLARPGGNITGVTNLGTELGGKRLELLKQAVPKVARVAVSIHQPLRPAYWR